MVEIVRVKLIRLHLDTYKRLSSLGNKNDSYNDIINKLLDQVKTKNVSNNN